MSKVALQKIRVTGFKRHYKILMQELHQSGILQLCDNPELNRQSVKEAYLQHYGAFDVARTEFAIEFLQPYQTSTSKLDSLLSGGKIVLGAKQMKERVHAFSTESENIIARVETLEDSLIRSKNERTSLPQKIELVTNLMGLHSEVQTNFNTSHTTTWIGKLPQAEKVSLMQTLAAESNLFDLSLLGETRLEAYVRVTTVKSMAEKVEQLLQTAGFQAVDLGSELEVFVGMTPSQIKTKLLKHAKDLDYQIEEIEAEAKSLSVYLKDLKILAEQQAWQKSKNEAQTKMFLSDKTFSFEAWIIKASLVSFTDWIKNAFVGEVVVEKIKPEKNEVVPTLLANNQVFNSFEPITEMYGLPRLTEFDPTPLLAPFFLIFFGLCLSDVGYGVILTGVALFFLLAGKFSTGAQASLRLFLYCGLAAILGGVLLGGYFGLTPGQIPFLTNQETGLFYGQLLTPTEGSGPIIFLMLSLILGVVHLYFGMIISFVQQLKNRDFDGAFFDTAMWMIMLGSLGLFALSGSLQLNYEITRNIVIVAAIALMITQSRAQKNWWLKPFFGLLGLYNITNYLSDLLSYSRIMALGLATGVVGFAMNLTAGIFSEMMPHPVLGIAVALFIVLLGHFLNFSLSLLGAFIHSGRLQFIEFFGKFYEGGGLKFQPFLREKKYLLIQDK